MISVDEPAETVRDTIGDLTETVTLVDMCYVTLKKYKKVCSARSQVSPVWVSSPILIQNLL